MAKLYLVAGMSGAGKTTFAKQLSEKLKVDRLDIDEFYARVNGTELIRNNVFNVWIEFFQAIHAYEISNTDVIVDTNCLTKSQRDQFIEWFPTFEHILYWINTPKQVCYQNNKNRNRVIPENRMNELWDKIENPNEVSDNSWEINFIINDDNTEFRSIPKCMIPKIDLKNHDKPFYTELDSFIKRFQD